MAGFIIADIPWDFLVESNSSLATEINKKSMEDMLIALEVANATDVGIDIRNIGLKIVDAKCYS